MKPFWAQTAAGVLICAVVAALALLPGKLLGPAPHAAKLGLPATVPTHAVHMVLLAPKPKAKAKPVRHHAPAAVLSVPQLAVVHVPVVTRTPTPAPARKPAHVQKKALLVSTHRAHHPRVPPQPFAPKPKPTAPAPTVTVASTDPQPLVQTAAPAAPATTTVATTTPPPPPDNGQGDGHGNGNGHGDGQGNGNGHGHGHNK